MLFQVYFLHILFFLMVQSKLCLKYVFIVVSPNHKNRAVNRKNSLFFTLSINKNQNVNKNVR